MLSSSVVSLSFSILTNFEYKKGIIQIILNSSVIDINHIVVIFFAIKIIKLITSGQERFEKGGLARFHKIIADFPRNMPVAAYFLENTILLLPGGGAFAHFLKPHRGGTDLQLIQKKMTNARGGGGWARLGLTKP